MNCEQYKELKTLIGCNSWGNEVWYFYEPNNEFKRIDQIQSDASEEMSLFEDNPYSYGFIPLPSLNMVELIDAFVETLNNKKISNYFKSADKSDSVGYWVEFDKMFPVGTERRCWDDFYDERLDSCARKWCKENHIFVYEKGV